MDVTLIAIFTTNSNSIAMLQFLIKDPTEKCMSTSLHFSAILTKGNNFHDFLYASLVNKRT